MLSRAGFSSLRLIHDAANLVSALACLTNTAMLTACITFSLQQTSLGSDPGWGSGGVSAPETRT